MINAKRYRGNEVSLIYSRRSRLYSKTVAPLEFPNHLRAIAKAAIQPNDRILEVAVGPGLALREMVKRVDNLVYGVDLAPGMLAVAEENLKGLGNVKLMQGSAHDLPIGIKLRKSEIK